MSKELLKTITVDYAIAFGKKIREQSPEAIFCFLSGAGADLTEKSRMPFARFKGMAENALLQLEFYKLVIFQPGYIYPVQKRIEPSLMYNVSRLLYPLIKCFGKNASIKSTELAEAMYLSSFESTQHTTLTNRDILSFLEKNKPLN